MEFEQIKELLGLFDRSSLTTISINVKDMELKMGKLKPNPLPFEHGSIHRLGTSSVTDEQLQTVYRFAPSDAAEERGQMSELSIPKPEAIRQPITIIPAEKPVAAPGELVRSPIVGTFYAGPSPDSPPFVSAGAKVGEGDVLCIVEAMKVMNEITAKRAGTVAEAMVKSGEMVEYGQPLFRII